MLCLGALNTGGRIQVLDLAGAHVAAAFPVSASVPSPARTRAKRWPDLRDPAYLTVYAGELLLAVGRLLGIGRVEARGTRAQEE